MVLTTKMMRVVRNFFLVGWFCLYATWTWSQSPDKPNILFIAIDDLNDWIGVLHGHPQVQTLHMDRLAKRGVLFANAHTQASLCNPSRTSVLTGLRPGTTGIYGLAPRYRTLESTRYHLGEKGITGKNSLWEPATPVPLIFVGPGIPEGHTSQETVELLDIYPTLVSMADLPTNTELEGVSLTPIFQQPDYRRDRLAISTHNPDNHAARNRRWRYISYADGSEELFEMMRDPHEFQNLASFTEYDSIKGEMKKWVPV